MHRRRQVRQPYTVDTIRQLFCCRWNANNEKHNAAMRTLAISSKKSNFFLKIERRKKKLRLLLSCPLYVAHTMALVVSVKNGPELNLIWGKRPRNSEFPVLRKKRMIGTNSENEGISIVLFSNPHGENFRVNFELPKGSPIFGYLSYDFLFFPS